MLSNIKVGPLNYDLILIGKEHLSEDSVGLESFYRGSIRILDTLKDDFMLLTLWHEIVHVIAEQHNLNLNEGEVDAIAAGVMQVLQDNQELVEMFHRDFTPPLAVSF